MRVAQLGQTMPHTTSRVALTHCRSLADGIFADESIRLASLMRIPLVVWADDHLIARARIDGTSQPAAALRPTEQPGERSNAFGDQVNGQAAEQAQDHFRVIGPIREQIDECTGGKRVAHAEREAAARMVIESLRQPEAKGVAHRKTHR